MEYSPCKTEKTIVDYLSSENEMKFVGWSETIKYDNGYKKLFSTEVVKFIQNRVMEILTKAYPDNRPIMPTEHVVLNAISTIYKDSRPGIGDIFTRYTIIQNQPRCDPKTIIFRTINTIARHIMNEYDMLLFNKSLTKWTTVLGDFNKDGLRSHAPIKLRERRTQQMMFNMNY